MSDAATVRPSDRELISALRAFPSHVLPIGVLRELARRGRSADEELLRLSRDELDQALGGLAESGTVSLLVAIGKEHALEETLAWIDRMVQDDFIDTWSRVSILSTLPYLVRDVGLDRNAATDRLSAVLLRRQSQRQDLVSAAARKRDRVMGRTWR